MSLNALTKRERVMLFATAPRASTGITGQLENGDIRNYHVGKLRGRIVSRVDGKWKFESKDEALAAARDFRERAKDELSKMPSASSP